MALWKLGIEDYGKIKGAEIEIAPLTLFVGDNNSGKSYLLSLLWGIQSMGVSSLMGNYVLETEGFQSLTEWIRKQMCLADKSSDYGVCLGEISDLLSGVLNSGLKLSEHKECKKICEKLGYSKKIY